MSNYFVEVSCYSANPMNPNQREHWSIFVSTDGVNGTIYEATGGTLQMNYNQKADVQLTKSSPYKGKVCLGAISEQQHQTLGQVLSGGSTSFQSFEGSTGILEARLSRLGSRCGEGLGGCGRSICGSK